MQPAAKRGAGRHLTAFERCGDFLPGSFNNYARKVRDSQRPIRVRRSALASCILRLGWLTGKSFLQVRSCYATRFSLGRPHSPTEAQLVAALTAIERDRNTYLETLRAFERKRIRQKMRGQRHPRKADREALASAAQAISVKAIVNKSRS